MSVKRPHSSEVPSLNTRIKLEEEKFASGSGATKESDEAVQQVAQPLIGTLSEWQQFFATPFDFLKKQWKFLDDHLCADIIPVLQGYAPKLSILCLRFKQGDSVTETQLFEMLDFLSNLKEVKRSPNFPFASLQKRREMEEKEEEMKELDSTVYSMSKKPDFGLRHCPIETIQKFLLTKKSANIDHLLKNAVVCNLPNLVQALILTGRFKEADPSIFLEVLHKAKEEGRLERVELLVENCEGSHLQALVDTPTRLIAELFRYAAYIGSLSLLEKLFQLNLFWSGVSVQEWLEGALPWSEDSATLNLILANGRVALISPDVHDSTFRRFVIVDEDMDKTRELLKFRFVSKEAFSSSLKDLAKTNREEVFVDLFEEYGTLIDSVESVKDILILALAHQSKRMVGVIRNTLYLDPESEDFVGDVLADAVKILIPDPPPPDYEESSASADEESSVSSDD